MEQKESRNRNRYSIEIEWPSENSMSRPDSDDDKYTIFYRKNFGDMYGGCQGCKDIEELRECIRHIRKRWEEYDSILGRIPDKVTQSNLHFESVTPDVSISDVLGTQTLSGWMR